MNPAGPPHTCDARRSRWCRGDSSSVIAPARAPPSAAASPSQNGSAWPPVTICIRPTTPRIQFVTLRFPPKTQCIYMAACAELMRSGTRSSFLTARCAVLVHCACRSLPSGCGCCRCWPACSRLDRTLGRRVTAVGDGFAADGPAGRCSGDGSGIGGGGSRDGDGGGDAAGSRSCCRPRCGGESLMLWASHRRRARPLTTGRKTTHHQRGHMRERRRAPLARMVAEV